MPIEFIRRFLLHVLACRLRQDPPLRIACQPQPPSGACPLQDSISCTTAVDPGSLLTEQQMSRALPLMPGQAGKYGTMHVVARSFCSWSFSSAALDSS